MKVKLIVIFFLFFLFILSVGQIFNIPPYSDDIFTVYKSGYFKELERGFITIKDAFLGIKSKKIIKKNQSCPEYAWIYLQDIKNSQDITVKVFNRKAQEVPAPGITVKTIDKRVLAVINSEHPAMTSSIINGQYYTVLPLVSEKECAICHHRTNKRNIIGALIFKRDYDAYIYYSSERKIIFIVISVILLLLILLVFRWEPHQNIKELFDKK